MCRDWDLLMGVLRSRRMTGMGMIRDGLMIREAVDNEWCRIFITYSSRHLIVDD